MQPKELRRMKSSIKLGYIFSTQKLQIWDYKKNIFDSVITARKQDIISS